MMALLRLNTDIPNDVFPSNCRVAGSAGRCGGCLRVLSLSLSLPLPP